MFNKENNEKNTMKFPRPLLLIGEEKEANFLDRLTECQENFICIATKDGTLKAIKEREEQNTWLYDPKGESNRNSFNWIPLCEQDEVMALTLARTILANNKEKNTYITGGFVDEYLEQKSLFLAALFAHTNTLNSATPSNLCNFVSEFISQEQCNPTKLLYLLLDSQNELARKCAKNFMKKNPYFLGGLVWNSVDEGLGWIKDIEKRFLDFSALESPDFGKLRRERVRVCLNLTKLGGLARVTLSALFFDLALQQLRRVREGQTVYLFQDDLTVGKIPDLAMQVGMIRAFGIGLVMAVPCLDKLERLYGRNDAKVILGNTLIVEAEGVLEGVLA